MSSLKVQAVVLRHADYGEGNRMLTLLTPGGLLSASARGCRKAASRTLTCTEVFTQGEYLLYERDGRYSVSGFQLQENFYPLRNDFDRLSHGIYWLNLCETAAQPGEDCGRLLKMLLFSLTVLAYGQQSPRALTAVFLAQFARLQGFAPRLDVCGRCGKPAAYPMRFDVEGGGVCCAACALHGLPLHEDAYAFLVEAQQRGAFVLAGREEPPLPGNADAAREAMLLLRAHVEHRLDRSIVSGKFL